MVNVELIIIKRDKEEVKFNLKKVRDAIEKAFIATETAHTSEILDLLALRVSANFQDKIVDMKIGIESVQDSVEQTLEETGFTNVAKAYILYRKQREKIRNMESTYIDYKNTVNSYVKSSDWRVKENSTVTYSVGGLILHNSGAVTANYWLSEVYDHEIANAHKEGDFHIHDLSMLTAYCAGWSLKQLIEMGLGGVTGKITSAPAKHLHTLCNQMVNFLGIMQNEWAGAQAFSSFDTYLAPFVKIDNLSYKDVKQCIQSFIFGVNTPSRWGTQSPFSNITLDWVCPDDLQNLKAVVGGNEKDFTYGDCQKEMDMVNKAFIEIMIEGDASGRGFQYPIPTYNITKDFMWDTENAKLLFEMTAKYGTPYFQNFINSDMKPGDVRSMCCRLQLDKRELRKKTGGLFGSGEKTGSVGVVTINMPRIAYLAKNEKRFFDKLDRLMDVAKRSLEIKRKVVTDLLDHDFYPYSKKYLGNFDSHFSTIGLVGLNEMCLNASWIKKPIYADNGKDFTIKVLNYMRNRLSDYQEETGNLYNLEATPAESTTYRLAKMDRERYRDIRTAANDSETPFYTNSCHLPVDFTEDMFEALEIEDTLQTKFTGGTVFHTFLGEKIDSWENTANLVKKIAERFHLPYFTMSPTYSICKNCGYIAGEIYTCEKCGEKTEVYSRITGYYRPVQHWNDGKQQEFEKRKEYVVSASMKKQNKSVSKPVSETSRQFVAEQVSVPKCEEIRPEASAAAPDVAPFKEVRYDEEKQVLLFTSKSCPNCPKAKEVLLQTRENVTVVDAQENIELARIYGIRSVPSLVIKSGNITKNFTGLSDIISFSKNINSKS